MKIQTVEDLVAFLEFHKAALGEAPRVHLGCSLQPGKAFASTGQDAILTLQAKDRRPDGLDFMSVRVFMFGRPGTSVKKPCKFDLILSFCSARTGATIELMKRNVEQRFLLSELFGAVETLFDPI